MKNFSFFLLTLFYISTINGQNFYTHPDLESIFKCNDLSYLNHNFVASHNPAPHGWEGFTHAQSAIGRFTFPDVMTMHTGEVYTTNTKGVVMDQIITKQEWVPWLFKGENDNIEVKRTVGKDIFMAEVSLKKMEKGLVILEFNKFSDHYYRNSKDIELSFDKQKNAIVFKWKEYSATVSFSGNTSLDICQDPQPLIRKFNGFDDVVIKEQSVLGCWQRNGSVFIGATFDKKVDITIEVTKGFKETQHPSFENLSSGEKQYWNTFFNTKVPPLKTQDPVIRDAYYFAWASFWSNLSEGGNGMTPYPYFCSAKYMYPMQFYWDEAFHAALLTNLKDTALPFQFLKNFAYCQAPDGGIPGSISFSGDFESYLKDATKNGSGDAQPSVIGVSLRFLKQNPGWKNNSKLIYDLFSNNIDWLYKNRDSNHDGLVEYINSFTSGCDNSPRFDSLFSEKGRIGKMKPIQSVEQNTWLCLLHNELAEIAEQSGDKTSAADHRIKAKLLQEKIEKYMWDEKTGFYYDIEVANNQKVMVKTQMGFMAMFLPEVNKDRVKRLVHDHLLNPAEFWAKYPVPSIAMNEPTFTGDDMWRGPVWININWLICVALDQNGYTKEAKELARRTVELVGSKYNGTGRIRTPRMNEWFNPLTGDPLGNENVSWSSLVADLILRFLNQ